MPKPSAQPRLSRGWVAVGLLTAMGAIFAGVAVVKVQRDNQEMVVESDDPDIEVVMRRNGALVRITDTKIKQTWDLDAKNLHLNLDGSDLSIELPDEEPLVLSRRGEKAVTIRRLSPSMPAKESSPSSDEPPDQVRRFVGHTGSVRAVAYSRDGKYVLSGSGWPTGDSTVRLWEAASGKEVWAVTAPGFVNSVAFCPHDRFLIGGNGFVQLRDLKTGDLIRTLNHPVSVHSVAASSNGRLALSGADDQTARVWDLETGGQRRVFRRHAGWVVSVAFSPDGQQAVSGGADGTVRVWDVETGKEVRVYRGSKGVISQVAFTPNGKQVLFGERDQVRLWDLESGAVVRSFGPLPDASGYIGLAVSPDGKRVLAAGTDKILRLWNLKGGKLLVHPGLVWVGSRFRPPQ